ncbi:growth arrest and DNA damage-inducible protein GADD45 alpha-like isoform X1 [Pomacea canaliculata]|uniref:growth arrest and DNA damage-inducible protein GADD45 alpha-like isoform X1 n=1 Tax=Pomacea canaliculata TaxID=400727 RepID=UPI000D738063|nr:growth arrest and DNA damage-inducible protein GADD45 alpha-like isoform X1 [Pomacea canaliculata]XP_025110474.1 growth arrest and DNA damage-inducible protein GADD45 alpha-like isoform X1 [Pomacea canaliculata]
MGASRVCQQSPVLVISANISQHSGKQFLSRQVQNLSKALAELVRQAIEDGRLTCGLDSCVKVLGSIPEEVMLCLMPVTDPPEPAVIIQNTLIRAFCVENNIRMLNVDSVVKLTLLIHDTISGVCKFQPDNMQPSGVESAFGYSCVLIEYPKHGTSEADETIAFYCKSQQHETSLPYLMLPD